MTDNKIPAKLLETIENNIIIADFDYIKQIIHKVNQRWSLTKKIEYKLKTISSGNITRHYYNTNYALTLKRSADILISVFALIICIPLILLLTLLLLFSRGPILFKQYRIGKNGKKFKFYKFRSMTPLKNDNEDESRKKDMISFMKIDNSTDGKIINNSRVTWIGKIIRKTSLDELPQLLNVLKGDMSIVGPRPCLPYEYENYDEWQKRRVNVIPGCTGVWQVWGRSSVSFKESVVLDLYYINNMSPWFDLQIMLQTVPAILTARGAE